MNLPKWKYEWKLLRSENKWKSFLVLFRSWLRTNTMDSLFIKVKTKRRRNTRTLTHARNTDKHLLFRIIIYAAYHMTHMSVSKKVGFYKIFLEYKSLLTLLFRKNEIVRNCEKSITWLFLNIHETLLFWKIWLVWFLFGFGSKTYPTRASNALKAFFYYWIY